MLLLLVLLLLILLLLLLVLLLLCWADLRAATGPAAAGEDFPVDLFARPSTLIFSSTLTFSHLPIYSNTFSFFPYLLFVFFSTELNL